MARAGLLLLGFAAAALAFLAVVRFVPGAPFAGSGSYDMYVDGHCEYSPDAVEALSWAVFGSRHAKPSGSTLSLRVVDLEQVPIDGARVDISSPLLGRSATTGDGGVASFQVPDAFDGEDAYVSVTAPQFVSVHQKLALDTIVLLRELIFRGRLVDEVGQPIVGATVAANGGGHAVTDSEGRFSIGQLKPGEAWLTLGLPKLEADAVRFDGRNILAPQTGEPPTFTATRGGGKARIAMKEAGGLGSWCRLTQRNDADPEPVEVAWRGDAAFTFVGLEPGEWWVYFHRASEPGDVMHRVRMKVTPGAVTELELPYDAPPFRF